MWKVRSQNVAAIYDIDSEFTNTVNFNNGTDHGYGSSRTLQYSNETCSMI